MAKLKGEMNMTLNECPSFTKVHVAYSTVKSFFYMHSISELSILFSQSVFIKRHTVVEVM